MARTAIRRHTRLVHGLRRIREDRAEHGEDHSCPCFEPSADRGRGYIFAMMADTPKRSQCSCCGNPRRYFGELTLQEQRAPTVDEWL